MSRRDPDNPATATGQPGDRDPDNPDRARTDPTRQPGGRASAAAPRRLGDREPAETILHSLASLSVAAATV